MRAVENSCGWTYSHGARIAKYFIDLRIPNVDGSSISRASDRILVQTLRFRAKWKKRSLRPIDEESRATRKMFRSWLGRILRSCVSFTNSCSIEEGDFLALFAKAHVPCPSLAAQDGVAALLHDPYVHG